MLNDLSEKIEDKHNEYGIIFREQDAKIQEQNAIINNLKMCTYSIIKELY